MPRQDTPNNERIKTVLGPSELMLYSVTFETTMKATQLSWNFTLRGKQLKILSARIDGLTFVSGAMKRRTPRNTDSRKQSILGVEQGAAFVVNSIPPLSLFLDNFLFSYVDGALRRAKRVAGRLCVSVLETVAELVAAALRTEVPTTHDAR